MKTDNPTRKPRWARTALLPLVGAVLISVGVGVGIWTAVHPISFGWFAYAPLSDTRFDPLAGSELGPWGPVLIASGLLVLAFWAGILFGARHKATR